MKNEKNKISREDNETVAMEIAWLMGFDADDLAHEQAEKIARFAGLVFYLSRFSHDEGELLVTALSMRNPRSKEK